MKTKKDRVVAIDYFRGICIVVVVVNHAMIFSLPFAYLTGAGRLWTSAAEMLMLISGLTFGIIRTDQIKINFRSVYKKTLKRAAQIYLVNVLAVALSLILALFAVSHNLTNDVDGSLPTKTCFSLLWSIINLSYSIGWASFLGLFAVFISFAPAVLYALRTKLWLAVPLLSAGIYIIGIQRADAFGAYNWFALWQVYFILGLLLSKFRVSLISTFYGLKTSTRLRLTGLVLSLAAVLLSVCILVEDNNILYPRVAHLAQSGWLPLKVQAAYQHLLLLKPSIDGLLMDSRAGILRPAFALLVLAASYLVYQSKKDLLLQKTGAIVTTLGKDTLWIFAAQAFAIPLLAMVPLQRDNLLNSFILTATLLLSMMMVTKRHALMPALQNYAAGLKLNYNEAKYNYLQRYEEENI
jgi:hypothetical protein